MALLGVNDLKQFALPTGWDASEILKYNLADGSTVDDFLNDVATALAMKNEELLNDPRYGGLMHVTDELSIEYRDGSAQGGMQERGEYTKADARRGGTIGHMLPLKSYDRTLGWTWDFLRKARVSQLEANIGEALFDVEENWENKLLTRAFSTAETLMGTAGYDVPFIAGSGGNVDYTPPAYAGQTFATSHTHFDRKTDDATGWAAALEAGAEHLHEHGLMAPYTAIWAEADIANVRGLTGFVKRDYGIQYVRTDSGVNYGVMAVDDRYIGAYESAYGLVYVWVTNRLPANYMGMYKSFGANDSRNPLAVRFSPDLGIGALLMRGAGFREFPIEDAVIIHEFGVGVSDRLNFYACEFDSSGSYASPTIG